MVENQPQKGEEMSFRRLNRHAAIACLALFCLSACVPLATPQPPITPPPTQTVQPTPIPLPTIATPTMTPQLSQAAPPAATLTVNGVTQTAGVGSYCWVDQNAHPANQVCADLPGTLTSSKPLQTGTPYTAHFHLQEDYPPQSLYVSVMAISPTQEAMTAENNGLRLWKPAPGWGGSLPLKTESEYEFQEGNGLYAIQLNAEWKDLGWVTYGFLVQVATAGQGVSESGTQSPPSQLPTPAIITLPNVVRLQQFGKGTAKVMALSPDGRWVVMIKAFGIYGFDTTTQSQVWVKPFTNAANSLNYSPDSQRLAIGSSDNILSILDAHTGNNLLNIQGEEGIHAAWSPDGKQLLTSANCEEVKVWDAITGNLVHVIQGAKCNDVTPGSVNAAWSFDGKRIYVNKDNGVIDAWDATNYQPITGFHAGPLPYAFGFEFYPSPAQNLIAIENGLSIAVLDGETGEIVRMLTDERIATPPTILWSPDGKQLIANNYGIHVSWDVATGQPVHFLEKYGEIAGLSWSSEEKPVSGIVSKDDKLAIIDLATGNPLVSSDEYSQVSEAPISLKWDGADLLTYNGSEILRWDMSTGRLLSRLAAQNPKDWPWLPDNDFIFSPDGTRRIEISTEATIRADGTGIEHPILSVVDSKNGKALARLDDQQQYSRDKSTWSSDGKRIVSGDSFGLESTIIWDAATGKVLFTLPNEFDGQRASVGNFKWSPDGLRIAAGEFLLGPAGENKGLLVVWDASTGKQDRVLTAGLNNERVDILAWSPDAKWLVEGLASGQILLWDIVQYRPLAFLIGHEGLIAGFSWSDDSRFLAANGSDGTVMIWKLP